jgi:RHS repeat-associated protein
MGKGLSRVLAQVLAILSIATTLPAAASQVTYYHTDALGSVVMESNEAGQVVYQREYRPYGESALDPPKDGPAYTGHVQDTATDLTYMQQRYYDPGIGRFLSVDPVTADGNTGGNFNRYWYANNNPYKFTDPDGREVGVAYEKLYRADGGVPSKLPANTTAEKVIIGSTLALVAAPLAIYGGEFLFYNPYTANSIGVAGAEAVAGVPLGVGGYGLFRNLAPADEIGPAVRFSASQIQQVGYSGRLNYIVDEAGSLVIGRTGHTSLAGGAPVQAAGEARFVDGALRGLDNASGHYRPVGESAKKAAENAFEKAGFDAAGKYMERNF